MRVRDTEIFADQNIHGDVVAWLRCQGISARTVAETLDREAPDEAIATSAALPGTVILTHDRDFGLLVEMGSEATVLYVRPGHYPPAETISQIERVLDFELPDRGSVLVIRGLGDRFKTRLRLRQA